MKTGLSHKYLQDNFLTSEDYSSSHDSDPNDLLPRTYSEDRRRGGHLEEESPRVRQAKPNHKRTMSDTSHTPVRERRPKLPKPVFSELPVGPSDDFFRTDRPKSPSQTDDDMSESELLIRRIIRQRVIPEKPPVSDYIVEERASEEEESDSESPIKTTTRDFGVLVEEYILEKKEKSVSEGKKRMELKRRILTLLQSENATGEEKMSQRETPQMSMLLPEALRSSSNSTATITGPGGSFHVQDIFSSDDSIEELNSGIKVSIKSAVGKASKSAQIPIEETDLGIEGRHSDSDLSPILPNPRFRSFFAEKGNVEIVRKIIETVCLPGDLFLKQRIQSLEALESVSPAAKVVILLSSAFPINQYCGVYETRQDGFQKITGSVFESEFINNSEVDSCLSFNQEKSEFVEVKTRKTCDAIRLKT